MLVKNDDVEKYLSGEDVPVVYVQFRMFGGNAKAHSAPWGVTQTYFQMNSGGTMQPNTTSGDFTPTSYGVTDITGNASEDMARLLTLARDYASKGRPVYWWPTIEATREDLDISTLQSFTSLRPVQLTSLSRSIQISTRHSSKSMQGTHWLAF